MRYLRPNSIVVNLLIMMGLVLVGCGANEPAPTTIDRGRPQARVAALVATGCQGSCDAQAPDGTCWCDDLCHSYGDCCFDKTEICGDGGFEPGGTCESSCGANSADGTCWCDDVCTSLGDCCDDKEDQCPTVAPGGSCVDSCGQNAADGNCWCDDLCTLYGDCCDDKEDECATECAPPSCDLIDDAVCTYTLDADGCVICECEPPPVCEPPTCLAELIYCEFGFALDENGCETCDCYEPTCWGAWIDETGTCRSPNDGVYPQACCANECPPVVCFMYCEEYVTDETGCDTCECAQP